MRQVISSLSVILERIGQRITTADLAAIGIALPISWLWLGSQGMAIVASTIILLSVLRAAKPPADPTTTIGEGEWRDAISGMMMRSAVEKSLSVALKNSAITGKTTAALVLCLDDPQSLLERYGQAAHDQIMRRVAERIYVTMRQHDTIARLEGARFAVALGPVRRIDLEAMIQLAARLQQAVQEPLSVDATTVYISCSIGFCLPSRAPEATGEAMLAAAETANDDAWRNGPSAIRAYSSEIASAASDRKHLRGQVEAAIEMGQVVAYFQPQLSTDTGEVSGFEALARWKHPEKGLLPPAEFLPAIASTGLAPRLGEVMLFQTLNALRTWDRAGYHVPSVAVNFCKEELRNVKIVEKLRWELDRFEIAPERLTIEILETVVAETENDTVVHNIAALSEMGCKIDLDDFGTGHASITSIRRFAVNRIKIDRSFVTRVDSDAKQQRMLTAILSMAERLELETLAEGVETAGEFAMLSQLGCCHVQGFAIARPMPFDETIGWMESHAAKLHSTAKLGRKIV
ncbi:MAG: bifunctional diguanylate cyclase/phosphodiesterase [Paracoccaceae bacterium]